MTPGSELELTIHDIAFGGAGVGRHEGQVVFVPFTAIGERVRVQVVKRKKNFVEADLLEVIAPASSRVEPLCPYFGRCGGCAYQHMDYAEQLRVKQQQVEQTLRRVGRLEQLPMRPIVAAPHPFGYRNRIRVHVAGGVAGFFAHRAHTIVDVEECRIASPTVNAALKELRHAAVPEDDYSLRASGGGGPFFEQTNPDVTEALVALVRGTVRKGQRTLVDAYCGAGLFARKLVDLFEEVVGIEENANAVEHARRRASERERYLQADVSAVLGEVLADTEPERTTVILDPPATGVVPRALEMLIAARPSELLYVSCNPATLARDFAQLAPRYELQSVTPLDMFPQTAEIEMLAHALARRPDR